ncbi:MAG TPA: hypothetical protein VGD89_04560, partial [Flavipsychrobacter sp.]
MKKWKLPVMAMIGAQVFVTACNNDANTGNKTQPDSTATPVAAYDTNFNVEAEAFADIQMLRYQVPGWDGLSLQQKQLSYYLYEAALCGRDIIYDQKSKYGILLRKTLETVYTTYNGNKDSADWKKFEEYCGRFWFSNGNHHHYSNEKFLPECKYEYFAELVKNSDQSLLPKEQGETVEAFLTRIKPLIYDPKVEPKVVDLRPNVDNVVNSSNNFYEGVTQKEVEAFYSKFDTKGNAPSWGLNSKLMKENGQIVEKTWKVGGMYSASIEKIVGWL